LKYFTFSQKVHFPLLSARIAYRQIPQHFTSYDKPIFIYWYETCTKALSLTRMVARRKCIPIAQLYRGFQVSGADVSIDASMGTTQGKKSQLNESKSISNSDTTNDVPEDVGFSAGQSYFQGAVVKN
jgi:hypothetical protein